MSTQHHTPRFDVCRIGSKLMTKTKILCGKPSQHNNTFTCAHDESTKRNAVYCDICFLSLKCSVAVQKSFVMQCINYIMQRTRWLSVLISCLCTMFQGFHMGLIPIFWAHNPNYAFRAIDSPLLAQLNMEFPQGPFHYWIPGGKPSKKFMLHCDHYIPLNIPANSFMEVSNIEVCPSKKKRVVLAVIAYFMGLHNQKERNAKIKPKNDVF